MKNYNFMTKSKNAFIAVAVILVIGLIGFFILNFNLDIDFAGGSEIHYNMGIEVTSDVRDAVKSIANDAIGSENVSSVATASSDSNILVLRTKSLSSENREALEKALTEKYEKLSIESINQFGATMSSRTVKTVILSTLIAVAAMLIYIWIRFQLASGIAAIVCLIFNLFAMFTLYSFAQIPVNSNVIAACLTILGYSINNTIVIFDRVRENIKKDPSKSFAEHANNGIHETLNRSVFSTVTTLLTIGMVYILGVEQIRYFALPLIIGIIAGLFSSIFIACPVWGIFRKLFGTDNKNKSE